MFFPTEGGREERGLEMNCSTPVMRWYIDNMKKSEYSRVRAKWRRWIKRIRDSAFLILLDDYIFRKSMEAAQKGNVIEPTNEVYRWAMRIYASHAAIGVRRLLDKDDRTYSLLLLLSKIEKNPQVITRRSFVLRYSLSRRDIAMSDFDDLAGSGVKSLPHNAVRADLNKLFAISDRIRPIVNKVIAHHQRKPRGLTKPTWQEIHDAIDQIVQICDRYHRILNQVGTISMLPSINVSNADRDVDIVWAKKTA